MKRTHFSALRIWLLLLLVVFASTLRSQGQRDYTQFVDPFIGTDGTGHTFPGACVPFGMVQPGPDNRNIGWDYCSGYQYRDSIILGFSQTHLSGTGIGDLGDVLVLPFLGEHVDNSGTRYDKKSETASPGYYRVMLADGINVELTASQRVAFHRYTFPHNGDIHCLVDVQHGIRFLDSMLVQESDVHIIDDRTIAGYCRTSNWVKRKYYFELVFDRPFTARLLVPQNGEKAPRYVLTFSHTQVLRAKVALSTVGVDGANKNLAEVSGWDFDSVRAAARESWNGYLSRIEIEGTPDEVKSFYTALYHLCIQPNNIADRDGQYRGPDDRIHRAAGMEYYSTLSLWDIYRAAFPLYTIIAPERVDAIINSLLNHAQAAGFLPIFTVWGQENYCMIGNHALPLICEAYMEGFRGFDSAEALRAMVRSTTENHLNSDWALYNRYGYYPYDSVSNEAVSRTLESCVDDYCIALMARRMGRDSIADVYDRRAQYYRNLFDPSTRQFRGKDTRGRWRTPFDPLNTTSPLNNPGDYTEANAWQYLWTPAQVDPEGTVALLNGRDQMGRALDAFFSLRTTGADRFLGQEGMIGQYAHGNEPSHHVAYLYRYSSEPGRTDELVTRICREFYRPAPNGLTGNDDCGQMSAWYIFSMLGIYPGNPANGTYLLGMPQVGRAVIHLKPDRSLVIQPRGQNNGASHFLRAAINGEPLGYLLTYRQITDGGVLTIDLQ